MHAEVTGEALRKKSGPVHSFQLPKRTLSRREHEVVVLLCEGYSVKRVATTLGIAYRTADKILENLMRKLDVTTRIQVVRWAVETGVGQRETSE